jgi:hypothetical protein
LKRKKPPTFEFDPNTPPLEMIRIYKAERDRLLSEQNRALAEIEKILRKDESNEKQYRA